MRKLIQSYIDSCALVRTRIHELSDIRERKRKLGCLTRAEEHDLDKRIKLLYAEHGQMSDVIDHLTSYLRAVEQRVDT